MSTGPAATVDSMYVSSLTVYPVKSTAGLDVGECVVHPWGLENDRRWMVVDDEGETVTARTRRKLLHVVATPQHGGAIALAAPDMPALAVDVPRRDAQMSVTLSRLESALSAGPVADDWVSELLGESVHLVWLDDPRRRPVGTSHGGRHGDVLNLADAGPILLTATASLSRLDEWLEETAAERGEQWPGPLAMRRFRPNIVVEDVGEPFAEDEWKLIRVGDVELRFGEHCDRCALPTIDPVTLVSSKEPTRTLALRRHWEHSVFFGVRLIPTTTGVIRVGDRVSVC